MDNNMLSSGVPVSIPLEQSSDSKRKGEQATKAFRDIPRHYIIGIESFGSLECEASHE
jgi:hypothetical protein